MVFFFFLFITYFILNLFTLNLIFWWSVFIMMTVSFLFIQKVQGFFSDGLNYFLLQEFLGFLFLIFLGFLMQFLVLLMKIGVSPLHFWVISVLKSSENYLLMWFLTFQKLPFIPVILYTFNFIFFLFIIFGLVLCFIQIYFIKDFKLMFIISSTESFSWIIFGLLLGLWGFMFFFIYYLLSMIFLLNYMNISNFHNFYLELVLVFLNMPLTISFFLKIFMLNLGFLLGGFWLLMLLFLMFLSSLSFMNWLMALSSFSFNKFKDFYTSWMMMYIFFFFFIYFFHFSKI